MCLLDTSPAIKLNGAKVRQFLKLANFLGIFFGFLFFCCIFATQKQRFCYTVEACNINTINAFIDFPCFY